MSRQMILLKGLLKVQAVSYWERQLAFSLVWFEVLSLKLKVLLKEYKTVLVKRLLCQKLFLIHLVLLAGGIIGGAAGAVKGVYNGIYYGVKEPFSQENFSVDGDFDEFEAFDYSKAEYGMLYN
jgi:hypothetical protein